MKLSRRIHINSRYSAKLEYRWHRRAGFSRRWCVDFILLHYGW